MSSSSDFTATKILKMTLDKSFINHQKYEILSHKNWAKNPIYEKQRFHIGHMDIRRYLGWSSLTTKKPKETQKKSKPKFISIKLVDPSYDQSS